MSAPVAFSSVQKRFGEGPLVLDQINLTAAPGEFISLIGPSGCGKSTLLRLIAGLSPISGGELKIGGAAETGFVFQDPTLLPWLTAVENVEIGLRLRGIGKDERGTRARQALQQVRLANRDTAYPRQLSGGQKMRVSLARALAARPRLLLLDEPFGALDEMTREHLNEELLALHVEQKWTAFFVTHSVSEAVFLSDRVVVLAANPGTIRAEIAISLPQPRTRATRGTEDFFRLVREVSQILQSVDPEAVRA